MAKKTSKRTAAARAEPSPPTDEGNIGGATDESVAELQLVVEMLLLGWVDPITGDHRYFDHDSREERAARHAVAYLLRNPKPLDFNIRNRLADLFDPTSVYARDLTLGFRREGGPKELLKHRRIAAEMRRMVRSLKNARGAVKTAIEAAAQKHALDERTVRRIWARYGKPMMT
jgi:hypothetical protein